MEARTRRVVVLAVALISLLFISALCAEEASSQESGSVKSIIYIYRTQRTGTRLLPLILLNGREIGIFAPHRYIKVEVDPGKVEVATSRDLPDPPFKVDTLEKFFHEPLPHYSQVELDAVAGHTYFVRGQVVDNPPIMIVDPLEGAEEVGHLGEVKCDFSFMKNSLKSCRRRETRGAT
jgi:hypothetical protein